MLKLLYNSNNNYDYILLRTVPYIYKFGNYCSKNMRLEETFTNEKNHTRHQHKF